MIRYKKNNIGILKAKVCLVFLKKQYNLTLFIFFINPINKILTEIKFENICVRKADDIVKLFHLLWLMKLLNKFQFNVRNTLVIRSYFLYNSVNHLKLWIWKTSIHNKNIVEVTFFQNF
jgi:hypothetical protein